ncbi:SIS domain-containing protein [Erwinia sp. CPCC 100877]|nr:SIS domain-containing protein [Erwinia sp. CPCC 100877]
MNLRYLQETYRLNKTDLQILSYLDRQSCLLSEISIRQTAKDCFTSPTSVMRLAKKLNLSGYNELLYKIKESHLPAPNVSEVVLSEKEITCFCQLMQQNQGNLITVLGNNFSAHVSAYISEVLNFHCIPCVTTAHTQLINSRNNQNILLIVVSHSGEEENLQKTVDLAAERNNTIISFLGTKRAPLATASDLFFSTNSYSPFSTNVAQPQLFFGRTLVTFETLICAYINSKENK